MKKSNKTLILSALAALAFGGGAVGSTFALFTSTAETNITVTAGKVDVAFTIGTIETGYDKTATTLVGANENLGATADEDGNITITNMLPGDYVKVPFTLTNNSTVAIKYRAAVSGIEDTDLKAVFEGVSDTWTTAEAKAALSDEAALTISLPVDATNQEIKEQTIILSVEAIQGNALITETIKTEAELSSALSDLRVEQINLSNNLVIENGLVSKGNKTLNLNGHTISNEKDIWSDQTFALIEVDSGTLTINGSNGGSLDAKEDDCYAVFCWGGNVVINGGTYIGNIHSVYVQYGTATINDGYFDIKQLSNVNAQQPYGFLLNCLDASYKEKKASITVYGGSYKNFDPSNNIAEGAGTSFTAEGYTSTAKTEGNDTIYTVSKAA